jgi:hypothetical protein
MFDNPQLSPSAPCVPSVWRSTPRTMSQQSAEHRKKAAERHEQVSHLYDSCLLIVFNP